MEELGKTRMKGANPSSCREARAGEGVCKEPDVEAMGEVEQVRM